MPLLLYLYLLISIVLFLWCCEYESLFFCWPSYKKFYFSSFVRLLIWVPVLLLPFVRLLFLRFFMSLFLLTYFKRRCFECGCLYFCQISEWAHLKTPTLMCICTELCYFQTFLHQKRKWFHLYALRKEMSNRIKWQFSTIHHVAWNPAISQGVFQPSSLMFIVQGSLSAFRRFNANIKVQRYIWIIVRVPTHCWEARSFSLLQVWLQNSSPGDQNNHHSSS